MPAGSPSLYEIAFMIKKKKTISRIEKGKGMC